VAGSERQDPDARLSRVIHALSDLHQRHVPEPHWYLMVIGVDPDRQRQGIGTALIDPVLRRADTQGLRSFLETNKESRIPFYERLGFQVVEHGTVDGLPDSWGMVRSPRPAPAR
jgi:ribosomal protein S18 acetylase RimI-like enzyme